MKKVFLKSFLLTGLLITTGLNYSCSSDSDDKEDVQTEVLNLRVIAAVLDSDGNVLNVQDAKANTTQDYITVDGGFKHRVLIEDFTGAWCGWCPRVSHSIEELENSNNADIVAVALHNGDKLKFSPQEGNLSNNLWTKYGIASEERGYPFASLNRTAEWQATSGNAMNKSQVTALIKQSSKIGIKISSNLEATSGKVNVSFKFSENYTGLKYVVYVVQDGIVLSQTNYTSNYNGEDKIKEFKHNAVTKATNDVLGSTIETSTSGSEFNSGDLNFTYKQF